MHTPGAPYLEIAVIDDGVLQAIAQDDAACFRSGMTWMQLMHLYVQKSRTTTLPRSCARVKGASVFIQSSPGGNSLALAVGDNSLAHM
ncbi:MAG: hypothetical protein DRI39_06590 [Chloroflexi bacterium]|nr:MAG: hypothetical protein DRI39_06590 [Chloroflexota bacterium]